MRIKPNRELCRWYVTHLVENDLKNESIEIPRVADFAFALNARIRQNAEAVRLEVEHDVESLLDVCMLVRACLDHRIATRVRHLVRFAIRCIENECDKWRATSDPSIHLANRAILVKDAAKMRAFEKRARRTLRAMRSVVDVDPTFVEDRRWFLELVSEIDERADVEERAEHLERENTASGIPKVEIEVRENLERESAAPEVPKVDNDVREKSMWETTMSTETPGSKRKRARIDTEAIPRFSMRLRSHKA